MLYKKSIVLFILLLFNSTSGLEIGLYHDISSNNDLLFLGDLHYEEEKYGFIDLNKKIYMWKRPEEVQLNKYVSSREFFNEVFNLDYMFLIEGVSPYFSATLNGSQIKMNPQEVGYQSYLSEIVFDANTIQKSGELIATFYSPDHRIYGTIFKSRVNSFGCEAFPTSGLKSVIAYINYDNRIYEGCITIINAENDIIEGMIIDD